MTLLISTLSSRILNDINEINKHRSEIDHLTVRSSEIVSASQKRSETSSVLLFHRLVSLFWYIFKKMGKCFNYIVDFVNNSTSLIVVALAYNYQKDYYKLDINIDAGYVRYTFQYVSDVIMYCKTSFS